MGLVERIEATEFVGQEFATWLCWHSETNNGKVKLDGVEEFELWFESPVQLTASFGEATIVTLKGATPCESPEARQAFREGKKIDRCRLRINFRSQTFTCSFNAGSFLLSGLKIPVPPNVPSAEYVFMRLEIFEEFEAFFHSVFEAFLAIRLDERKWATESLLVAEWVRSFAIA